MYKIDLAIIIGSLLILIGAIGYTRPLVISPVDGLETIDSVLFSIDNAEKIMIDDNIDFTSPLEYRVVDGLEIELEPGKYYWKAVGVFGSRIRTLTVNSVVSLKLERKGEDYEVVNSGNVVLDVDVYDKDELVNSFVLGRSEGRVSSGSKFEGEMK